MLPENWPRWIIVPIGLALVLLSIGIGLVLEPAVQAFAPHPEPTPTLPRLGYAAPLSSECTICHTDLQKLQKYIASEDERQTLFVKPSEERSVHGQLGCVTCHRGTPGTEDVDAAHDELASDPSLYFHEKCLLCHREIPNQFPNDLLRTPHNQVIHGLAENVTCSDCHGAVGHGFDPVSGEVICTMGACLDCHEERNLDTQLEDCNSCHIGPHDVAEVLNCSDCHTSTTNWGETKLAVHPVELTGEHVETDCFACHNWPNFRDKDYVCSDCHERPHEFGSEECADCHTPEGWQAASPQGHTFPVDHDGADSNCTLCHPGNDTSTYYCFTCHSTENTVSFHEEQKVLDIFGKCIQCHPQGG